MHCVKLVCVWSPRLLIQYPLATRSPVSLAVSMRTLIAIYTTHMIWHKYLLKAPFIIKWVFWWCRFRFIPIDFRIQRYNLESTQLVSCRLGNGVMRVRVKVTPHQGHTGLSHTESSQGHIQCEGYRTKIYRLWLWSHGMLGARQEPIGR